MFLRFWINEKKKDIKCEKYDNNCYLNTSGTNHINLPFVLFTLVNDKHLEPSLTFGQERALWWALLDSNKALLPKIVNYSNLIFTASVPDVVRADREK